MLRLIEVGKAKIRDVIAGIVLDRGLVLLLGLSLGTRVDVVAFLPKIDRGLTHLLRCEVATAKLVSAVWVEGRADFHGELFGKLIGRFAALAGERLVGRNEDRRAGSANDRFTMGCARLNGHPPDGILCGKSAHPVGDDLRPLLQSHLWNGREQLKKGLCAAVDRDDHGADMLPSGSNSVGGSKGGPGGDAGDRG